MIILVICLNKNTLAGPHQKKLLKKIFEGYNPLERPVDDESQTLNVSLGFALQQIVDVDEKKQV